MGHKTDWFKESKWGIFTHYLNYMQNSNSENGMLHSQGKGETSWDECVNDFDTDKYAKILHELGAGYAYFTITQGYKFMCAPNETFNEITGYSTGEGCSTRDLIADLITSLDKYNIPLMLYFTGDGPYIDDKGGKAFGFFDRNNNNVTDEFVAKWARVAKEYSLRYKDKIKGWWIDGCYKDFYGYNEGKLKMLGDAVRAGNPDTLVTFNNGVAVKGRYSQYEDYTAGEVTDFHNVYPESRFCDGSQWHVLSFLGLPAQFHEWGNPAWGYPGSKYSGEFIADYVRKVNGLDGVVSIDVCTLRDGSIDMGQIEVLKALKNNL